MKIADHRPKEGFSTQLGMNVSFQRPPRPQMHHGSGVGGGLFSLVDGLRGHANPMPGGSTRGGAGLLPGMSTKSTKPPMYVPPSTAPASSGEYASSSSTATIPPHSTSKNFIPPIASAFRPPTGGNSGVIDSNTTSNKRTPSAQLPTPNSKPTTPMSGSFREQTPNLHARRPPSTGTSGAAFHKGLVNALQDVLRKQRTGIFPGPDGMDEPTVLRPSTQPQPSSATPASPAQSATATNRIDELIRRKKTEWAQKRWQSMQQNERREMEREISSANAFSRRSQRTSSASSQHQPTSSGSNITLDGLFDHDDFAIEVMQLAMALERQERDERERLTQQFMRCLGDMLCNFGAFVKAKLMLQSPTPTSSASESSTSERTATLPSPSHQTSTLSAANGGKRFGSASSVHPQQSGAISRPSTGRVVAAASLRDTEELRQDGNRLYEQNDFCGAHRMYTLALERDPMNAMLLGNRAATYMMLLNYDACARDCLTVLATDPSNVKLAQRLAKAYALMGQYRQASTHYASAIRYAEDQGMSHAYVCTLQDELQASLTVERMRKASETDNHSECVALSSTLKVFQGEPPVVLLRAASLLVMDPTAARQELSRYFATLECPTNFGTSSDDAILSGSYFNHYCDVLVLLAKTSFYCGQHYVSIASTYIKQCLALRPEYRQAQMFAKVLTSLEARTEEANAHIKNGKFAEAHASLSLALALDTQNKKIRSNLFVSRAEISAKLGNVAAAISDCTSALECDSTLVKALTRRGRCFAEIGDYDRAVRDMERAVEINPSLADDLRAFRAQQADDSNTFQSFQRRFSAGGSRPMPPPNSEYGSSSSRPGSSRFSSSAGGDHYAQPPAPLQCHYSVLLLPRHSSVNQVKQQYKKLILQYHPDKVVNQPQDVRDACAAKFREISNAYGVLSDPAAKMQYDSTLAR